MYNKNLTVSLLPTTNFLRNDGTFDLDAALMTCGRIGGICYSPDGWEALQNENPKSTLKRVNMTLDHKHHSIYDHIQISLDIRNMPKILAMILNNEHQYTTSEKSARYTKFDTSEDSPITPIEIELYNKWIGILVPIIEYTYPNQFSQKHKEKLAMENARYFVSVFVPTDLIYTVPLAQLNRIVRWLQDYLKWTEHSLNARLTPYIKEFIAQLEGLNVLEPRLQTNEKERRLSLFARPEDVQLWTEDFSLSYSTIYKGSFAQLAQAHRHRTLDYQIFIPYVFRVFVPPIVNCNPVRKKNWLNDMQKVKDIYPQGQLVDILEQGNLDNFLLKCKERLCSAAQLEIMRQTEITLRRYHDRTRRDTPLHILLDDYLGGARCTFPDYTCPHPCGFASGIDLSREI